MYWPFRVFFNTTANVIKFLEVFVILLCLYSIEMVPLRLEQHYNSNNSELFSYMMEDKTE